MEIVGIYFDGEQYYIAGMNRQEKLSFLEIKKNLHSLCQWSVSLLADVVLKSFTAPISNRQAIMAAIPFQVEQLLPFPCQEAVVIPVIDGKKVLIFAAQKESVRRHIEKWDTPFISSYQMALYRYMKWAHPEKKQGVISFKSVERTFFISLEEGKLGKSGFLVAPYDAKEESEMFTYLGSQDCTEVDPHAVAIGLALDGLKNDTHSTQFREGEWAHPLIQKRKEATKKKGTIAYLAALLSLGFGGWAMGYRDEVYLKQAKEQFAKEYSRDMGALLKAKEEKVNFYGEAPKVSQVLAYLEQFGDLIEIETIKVELLQYPSLKDPQKKYKMQIRLHFQAVSPQGAKIFQDHLTGKNRWIDGKEEIEFKRSHDGYQATFVLAS
ncbi:MAG: hypothetical protein KBC64_06150 [Simkaniaceae bacterium]|nr:hypothetical protein [Simkaniaceae bacterium]